MTEVPTRPFMLNAFDMATVSHISFGMWRDPDDRTLQYNHLSYWLDLAKLLDDAGFDSLFMADVVGEIDVFGGNTDAALTHGVQTPLIDPMLIVSAMAAVTRDLGFGLTVSTTYEQPYLLARKFSTLDHLTDGRVAWNVVTSQLNSAAKNISGREKQIPHDERYELAQEFLDVTYKLWEGSWEDSAVVRDRATGVFADPTKVHPIEHEGTYFSVPGAHLSEPSVQRTPLIFQAGTSEHGRDFGASNAEVVFLGGPTPAIIRSQGEDIRARAVALGRRPDSIKFVTSVLVVSAADDDAAQARLAELAALYNPEAALVLFSAVTGVDWSVYDIDTPLEYIETDAGRAQLMAYTRLDPDRQWTLRDIFGGPSGIGQQVVIVGGPQTVADRLEALADEAGLDGFNLAYATMPGTFENFIQHVMPELRRRGRVRERQPGASLRQRVFGTDSSLLADDHPGARFRRRPLLTSAPSADGHPIERPVA